jgi:uncharacterized phiE125 gp8 family phage protein
MLLRRVTAATVSPVPIEIAMEHLRLDGSDAHLTAKTYTAAAAQFVGESAGRVLATERWSLAMPTPSGDVALPKSPVQSIASISYYDSSDASQSATVSDFYLYADDDRAFLRPKPGKSWPSLSAREDAVTIVFDAGYTVLPDGLRAAVLMMAAHLHENREAVAQGARLPLPLGVDALIAQHRIGWAAG